METEKKMHDGQETKILQRPMIFVLLEHRDSKGIVADMSLYFHATDEYLRFSDFLELIFLLRRHKKVNTELMKGLIAIMQTYGLEYEDTVSAQNSVEF